MKYPREITTVEPCFTVLHLVTVLRQETLPRPSSPKGPKKNDRRRSCRGIFFVTSKDKPFAKCGQKLSIFMPIVPSLWSIFWPVCQTSGEDLIFVYASYTCI